MKKLLALGLLLALACNDKPTRTSHFSAPTVPHGIMPPHEKIRDKMRGRRIPEFVATPPTGLSMSPMRAAQLTGTFRTLVILADFPDKPGRTPSTFFDNLIFGDTSATVKTFYQENSYGNFNLLTENAALWVRLPQPYAYYTDTAYGTSGYPENAQRMAEDAIKAADPLVNFSRYDNDGNGIVDGVVIIHAGTGAELTGSANDIWSHKWQLAVPLTLDGVGISDYCTTPEYWINPGDMKIGVTCHEMAHLLFGLPDLYSICGDGQGIGRWSLMAGGAWNGSTGLGDLPAHLDPQCKKWAGFLSPILADTTGVYTLSSVEDVPQVFRLGASDTEFFLIENRQKQGYDASLPGAGLLIWHLKQAFFQCHGWYPGRNADSSHYLVALEQADGRFDMEKNLSSGNAGDPYPGITGNTRFDSTSIPNSNWYGGYFGNPSGINISQISASGSTMSFALGLADTVITPPDTVVCSPDLDITVGKKQAGKVVTYPGECSPPSGSFFPVGTTIVDCIGNCTFTVFVHQTGRK